MVAAESDSYRNVYVFPQGMHVTIGLDCKSFDIQRKSELAMELENLKTISLRDILKTFVISDEIEVKRWEKVLWNGSYNMVGVLLNMNVGETLESVIEVIKSAMTKIWQIGSYTMNNHEHFPESKVDCLVEWAEANTEKDFIPSSVQGVRNGNPVEVGAILGNLVRAAKRESLKKELQVPTVENLHLLIKGVNYKLQSSKL